MLVNFATFRKKAKDAAKAKARKDKRREAQANRSALPQRRDKKRQGPHPQEAETRGPSARRRRTSKNRLRAYTRFHPVTLRLRPRVQSPTLGVCCLLDLIPGVNFCPGLVPPCLSALFSVNN